MDTLIIVVCLPFLVLQSASLSEHTEISDQSLKHPELCPPCYCENGTAICNSLGLTYIPKFPNGTQNVTFTRNSLKSITERTFSNLSHLNLLVLDLSDNDIRSISPEAFSTLRCLQNLCLRNNIVPITILSESFLGLRNLTSLNLRHMLLRNISSGFFKHLPSLSLEHLDISHNGLKQFNFDSLTKFPDLKILRVGHNPIKILQWKYYNALEEVSLDDCDRQEIPTFCSGNGSFFPKLKKCFFSHNLLSMLNSTFFTCLDTLEVAFLNNNPIRVIDTGTFAYLPNLQEVCMHHLQQLHVLHDYAFNNTNLGILNLRGSHLGVNEIDPNAFAGCYCLHTLDLGYNQFEFMDDYKFNQLFRDLNSLRNLTLTSTELVAVPSVISRVMFRLERLYMNKNKLQSLPKLCFIT
ncbi:insulin-like growth factor-binding protein complex acid labile subunit [Haliotis rubra]|uniref:insulin-like growth factor-binding protein complex acid labile subunit n=1 Tax=Haliotis rubra TaxID=36100 RepID=UPI001EE579B8|nr:insulin-like growth factor-binding protein complex acid labile subunit [Haliotis rubra]